MFFLISLPPPTKTFLTTGQALPEKGETPVEILLKTKQFPWFY